MQERIIERLKEQRDRDEREKGEELENNKKELKELKEKVSLLQGDLSDREVRRRTHSHTLSRITVIACARQSGQAHRTALKHLTVSHNPMTKLRHSG